MLQLTARVGECDVIRSRDVVPAISLESGGQFVTQQQHVRATIVCELLASERGYVKLLHDIIEVYPHRDTKWSQNFDKRPHRRGWVAVPQKCLFPCRIRGLQLMEPTRR